MFLLALCISRALSVLAHEAAHAFAAILLGYRPRILVGLYCIFGASTPSTIVPGIAPLSARACAIRHAGWIFSVALAVVVALGGASAGATLACLWTAADALTSDLVGATAQGTHAADGTIFFCGNFGLIMLKRMRTTDIVKLLRSLVQFQMMRGAQTAGIVTYKHTTRRGANDAARVGLRVRVCNGKRADLSKLIVNKCLAKGMFNEVDAPAVFQGHTRFATSSIANKDGCHPHQWRVPHRQRYWSYIEAVGITEGRFHSRFTNCESFITHNGDLDAFRFHGVTYSLGELQELLPALLHTPPNPAAQRVDSLCIAGLLDFLRTKGMWLQSLRYGVVSGGKRLALQIRWHINFNLRVHNEWLCAP